MGAVKLGLIVPSSNTTMEAEFWLMVSDWATVHTARIRLQNITIHDLGRMEEQAMDASLRLSDADGIFISCTNFRTVEIIDQLEKELGVPVISSNTATLWAMMKKLGVENKIEGLGALFR